MRRLLVTRDLPLRVGEVPAWSYELGRRFAARCNDFALVAPRVAPRAELDRNIPFGRVLAALPARDLDCSRRRADASEPYARVRQWVLDQLDGVFPLDGGCDTRRFTPGTAPRLARELGLSGRRVLLSRRPLTRASGIDTILYALSALAGRYPDLRYVVAGDGPERAELERLALRLHLAHKVQFLGQVADDRLPCLVQLCDIFVHAGRGHGRRRATRARARRKPAATALPPGVLRHAREASAPLGEARAPAPPRSERPGSAAHRSNDATLN